MKLIGSLTSPFVRKVRVALLEKNIPFELIIDIPLNPDTQVPKYNPLGKVPALVADDGSVWFDSGLLIEYLETLYPAVPLLPQDRRAALPVRQTLELIDGIVDAGVLIFLERRRTADKQDPSWVERQRGKIDRGLAMLDRHAHGRTFLHNDSFGMADIASVSMFAWLQFRLGDIDWRAQCPALTAFCARHAERPSFAQTVPVG